jgi:uncharacterized membrane protein
MSEAPTPPVTAADPPKPDAWGQLVTAVAIVLALWTIALGLVIVIGILLVNSIMSKDADITKTMAVVGLVTGTIGTVVGTLGSALQAPSGIGNVVRAVTGGAPRP